MDQDGLVEALARRRGSGDQRADLGEDSRTSLPAMLGAMPPAAALAWLIERSPSPRWKSWLEQVRKNVRALADEQQQMYEAMTHATGKFAESRERLRRLAQERDILKTAVVRLEEEHASRVATLEEQLERKIEELQGVASEKAALQEVAEASLSLAQERLEDARRVLQYLHERFGHHGPLSACFEDTCRASQHLLEDWYEDHPLGGHEMVYGETDGRTLRAQREAESADRAS